MTEHTPTPWKITSVSGKLVEIGQEHTGLGVCDVWGLDEDDAANTKAEVKANARHIVRCVNYHDRLVEALHNMTKPSGGTLSDNVAALELLEELEQQK